MKSFYLIKPAETSLHVAAANTQVTVISGGNSNSRHKVKWLSVILFLILILEQGVAWGQPFNYQSRNDGNWNNINIWSYWNGSNWIDVTSAQGYPGQLFAAGAVTTRRSDDISLNVAVPYPIASLVLGATGTNGSSDLTFANTGNFSLVINGSLTVTNGLFKIQENTDVGVTRTHSLSIGGNLTYNSNGIDLVNWGSTTNDDRCNITFNGTNHTISGNSTTSYIYNLTFTNNGIITINNNFARISGEMNVGSNCIVNPAAGIILNSDEVVGTIAGSGKINITRTASTADYVNQYRFTTNTLSSMTVDFSGNGAQTINSTVGNYGNLLTSTAGTKSLEGNVVVNGYVTIGSGTTLDATANNRTLSLGGNWTNNGTFTYRSGTVTFNGSLSAQTLGGTTNPSPFYSLTLSNSNGLNLGVPSIINGTLTLSSGRLTLGEYNLTLGSTAVAGTLSASNMIVATGTGECRRTYTANGSYTFPVGDETGTAEYSPISLNFASGSYSGAYAGVRVTNAKHPNNASTTNYLNRYWTVVSSGITSFSCTVTGTFVAADVAGTVGSQVAGKYNGSLPWIKYSTLSGTTLTASGVTAFSDFTGITDATPTVSISGGGVTVCKDASVTLTANPVGDAPFTYSWTGLISGSTTNPTATANTSTVGGPNSYTVTVTDGNGISSAASTAVTVTVAADPVAQTINGTPASGTSICLGGSVSAIFSGGSGGTGTVTDNYEYSLDGGSTWFTYTPGNSITSTSTGTNQVQIRTWRTATGTGCDNSGYNTAQWTVVADPTIGITSYTNAAICAGGSTDASATVTGGTGTLNYQWQIYNGSSWLSVSNGTPTGATYTNSTSATMTIAGITGAGSYRYRLIATANGQGCDATGTDAILSVNALPMFTAVQTKAISCFGATDGEITISVTSGQTPFYYRYSADNGTNWLGGSLDPNGWIQFTSGSTMVITAGDGTYLIHVKDGNGCEQTACP